MNLDFQKSHLQEKGWLSLRRLNLRDVNEIIADLGIEPYNVDFIVRDGNPTILVFQRDKTTIEPYGWSMYNEH